MLDTLILIPTEYERRLVEAEMLPWMERGLKVEIIGISMPVAAVSCMSAIALHRPHQIALVGIAGRYNERLEIGSAYEFTSIGCFGIGAADRGRLTTADQLSWGSMGWPGDHITLQTNRSSEGKGDMLLSCCAAAGSIEEADYRTGLFPTAIAEDMESYAVALACQKESIPLRIFRGISNNAGDRTLKNWQTSQAMLAAWNLFRSTL